MPAAFTWNQKLPAGEPYATDRRIQTAYEAEALAPLQHGQDGSLQHPPTANGYLRSMNSISQ